MKALLKTWGPYVLVVLLGTGIYAQWKAEIRREAVAAHELRAAREATQVALEAQAVAEWKYLELQTKTLASEARADGAQAKYAGLRKRYNELSASVGNGSGEPRGAMQPADADTGMIWVPKALLAAAGEALAAADEMSVKVDSMQNAMALERAAAEQRFQADAEVITQQALQIRQLEILLTEAKPGTLEQVGKAAGALALGYVIGKLTP